ncbi:tRNA N6-adenosine threonylcarbamoyltransferase, putative [Plasmodium malariae]|uniref:tRNA N6-adenosine threonylcarbamoyltransferase, putative n=1 Tax=Plasmodium malariae TaxID=5858 RepID=A0A1D3JIF0_PLAMA|nr:tRNA N6-adenosine threonylcarbamoyltransferase, putative [Plasmodium malariae]SBT86237.1 tRNA N6-adenosine threonylcarbamoyltransferase, putative [Plasmodium malariae]
MKNAVKNIALCLFIFLNLFPCSYNSYKIDNIRIKNPQFSDVLERTVKKINKYIEDNNDNYDICKYKKIPRILIERNKLKDNKKTKYIVGIENTCDDTCICIIDSNLNIIKNIIISHFKVVHKYEGVYPFFISSINNLFLKPYVQKALEGIDTKKIHCFGLSVCPGIAKNMDVAKNYIGEIQNKMDNIKISSVNHIFAHILSPLFLNFYDDKKTFTNNSEYRKEYINSCINQSLINWNVQDTIKKDKEQMDKVKGILQVLNSNNVTRQKLKVLSAEEFLNYGSYVIKKEDEKEEVEDEDARVDIGEDRKNISEIKTNDNLKNVQRGGYLTDGYVCILVSGGSTQVYMIRKNKKNDINVSKISQTVDISIGDIIDKIARYLQLPVGLGGGPFLEKKSEEFISELKKQKINEEACKDPFQPFPLPFSSNNIVDFSFSGIFNHMKKIIIELKKEESFEKEKDRYAYFCQKNIFKHLLKQINKIMYFCELHFNIKNLCIVGGVGCNNFLFESLKNMALSRSKTENQIKEYRKLKKRLKKKVNKIEDINYLNSKMSKNIIRNENAISSSEAWDIYLKYLLKKKTKDSILSSLKLLNFEEFSELKEKGYFLFERDIFITPNSSSWSVYKTPTNLSRDNAAMICFSTFLNLHNNVNIHEDPSEIKIKSTVKTKLENNFLLFSDIIVFDVFLEYLNNKKN